MIKIGIDASRSINSIQKTGVENVSDEIIKEIEKLSYKAIKEFEIVYYTPERISWLPDSQQRVLRWPFRFFWTQIRLSWEMLKDKPDVFFSPVHILPFFTPKKTFKIIHDIAFKKNKKIYNLKNRILLNLDLNRAVKKCKKIFVPSHQVKQDILKYTEIQEDRVIVIPHGYSCKIQNPINKTHNRKKQILYIGRVEAKKNILNLIKAFEIFNQKYPEYILILAGKINQKYVEKNREVFKTKNIQLLGYVSEQKKYQLLADSACFAYVSMEEGFGIPILEAFEFNLPVVCSNMPVLREVGADACVYVNYNSLQEIVESIEKIILDQSLQNSLIQNGPKQLEKFNWQGVSKKYLEEILN